MIRTDKELLWLHDNAKDGEPILLNSFEELLLMYAILRRQTKQKRQWEQEDAVAFDPLLLHKPE